MAYKSKYYIAKAYTPAPDYTQSYDLMEKIDTALGGNTGLTSGFEDFDLTTNMLPSEADAFTKQRLARLASNKTDFEQAQADKIPTLGETVGSTVLGAGKAIGGAFAQGVVNLAGKTAGMVERQATATVVDPNKGFFQNIGDQFEQAKTFTEKTRAVGKTMSMLINVLNPKFAGTGGEGGLKGFSREGGSDIEAGLKPVEQAIQSFANVEGQSLPVQILAGVTGSLPTSLATKVPVVGWFLMGNQSFRNSIEQTRAQMLASGKAIDENTMYLKALGDTAIEVGTEMMFPMFKKVGGTKTVGSLANASRGLYDVAKSAILKKLGKEVATETVETLGKTIIKQAAEEGFEEFVGAFLSGFLAKQTTMTDTPQWGVGEDEGLITVVGVLKAVASGSLSGGFATYFQNRNAFKNTKKALEEVNTQTVEEASEDDSVKDVFNAVNIDMQNTDNQEAVAEHLIDVIEEPAQEAYAQSEDTTPIEEPVATTEATIPSNAPSVTVDELQSQTQESTPETQRAVVEPSRSVAMTEEEYLSSKNLGRQGIGEPALAKNIGKGIAREQLIERQRVKDEQYTQAREVARQEYQQLVQDGKITVPTKIEQRIKTAQGNPENQAVQSARRLLTKQGISWEQPTIAQTAPVAEQVTEQAPAKQPKKVYTTEQLNTAKNKLLKRLQNPLNDSDKVDIQNQIAKIDKVIAKQEKSRLVAESQKQDTSGVQGVVSSAFVSGIKTDTTNIPEWKKTISKETEQSIDRASKPNADQSLLTMFREKLAKLHENVTLGSVPVDVSKGDIRKLFREARAASQYAKGQAENIISKSYNKAGKDKYDLLRHAIIYLDISEDLQAGLYNSDSSMMFNINSPQEALKTIVEIKAELAKPENELVREALDTRRSLMDEVRDEVITEGAKAGIDLKHIKSKANYMYHAVTEFRDEFNAALKARGTRRGVGRVEYMARVGSAKDYISDPMMADYLVLQKMHKDLARLRLYNEIKTEDISKTMPYTEEKDWSIKPGYSELDPSMLGIVEFDKFSKQQAKSVVMANLESRGIDPHSDVGKRTLAKIMTKYNNHVMIVPTQIVDAVVNEFANKETNSGKMFKNLMNVWKYMKIKMPNAVWKYNTRNLFGDLDPVVSAKPNALFRIPRALKELYGFFYKGGVLTNDLQDYIKRGGVTTGQTPQELKTFNTSKLIKVYDQSTKTSDVAKKAIRKIWSALTLETATQYREQVMRYATYLAYKSELSKNDTGLPKYYAASIPAEIQGLKDIKDRAYKLSNDLVGAYDDVSIAGQWASDHLMPFFRFKEINVKRNYRMIKNAFYTDGVTIKNTEQQARNKLGNIARASTFTVFRLTKLLLGTAAFYGALALGNGLLAGDDEEELPEDVKNSPHITIPRWVTGSNKVYYIDRLGSFAEFMNMLELIILWDLI